MKLLTLCLFKNSVKISILLVTTLVALSHETIRNASDALDSAPRKQKQSYNHTKSSALSETRITSTVRSWPSHKFFENVLSKPIAKEQLNTRSHKQKSKVHPSRQSSVKSGHHNKKTGQIETITNNRTTYKENLHNTFDNHTHPLNITSKNATKHDPISERFHFQMTALPHTTTILPFTQYLKWTRSGSATTSHINRDIEKATEKPNNSLNTTFTEQNPVHYKPSKISTFNFLHFQKRTHSKSPITKNSEFKGSKRTIAVSKKTISNNRDDEVVLPFTVTRANKNSHLNRDISKSSVLLKIASSLYKEDNHNAIKNVYKTRNKTKLKRPTIDKESHINDLLQWIDKDSKFQATTNRPNFPKNKKWGYTKIPKKPLIKGTRLKPTTETPIIEPDDDETGVQYEFTLSSTNPTPTTETISTIPTLNLESGTTSWKRVHMISPYPVAQPKAKKTQSIQSLGTHHWNSSGSIQKPSRSRPPESIPAEITTLRPTFESTELITHVADQITESTTEAVPITANHSTNIWYKPIINHFIASPSPNHGTESTATNSVTYPLVFKVWSINNGSLTLENEKEIPAWAINGFKIKDGSVLNLDQMPGALQSFVSTTLGKIKNKNGKIKIRPQQAELKEAVPESPTDGLDDSKEGLLSSQSPTNGSNSTETNPLNVNYVIWKTGSSNVTSSQTEEIIPESKTPETMLEPTSAPHVETLSTATLRPEVTNYLNQYLKFLTTSKPPTITKEPDGETMKDSWTRLEKLIFQSLLKATPIEHSSASVSKDSLQSKKTEDQDPELLSNLAAVAILISYMKSHPQFSSITTTASPVNEPSTLPAFDFDTAMYQLFQQLLSKKQSTDLNQRVKVDEAVTDIPNSPIHESKYPGPGTTAKPSPYHNPDRLTKTLLLKGIVKKGKKKKKKKLKKRRFKKKKAFILSSILSPIANLFKKPKKNYWVDLNFDIDFQELLKKKFLYLLALKYAPVVLVLTLGLLPLGLVIIPLLYKIYWVKKRPNYIRVPVPVPYPEPYPVYPYPPFDPHEYDHHYAADSSVIGGLLQKRKPSVVPIHGQFPLTEVEIPGTSNLDGITDPQMTADNLENYRNDKGMKPHAVNNAYNLGFDLGSKLGSITNVHDKEVLQILIDNKKNKINDLLEKWKLLQKGKSISPAFLIDRIGKQYTSKSKKRKKRKS